MTDTASLVERLRSVGYSPYCMNIREEAADALEAQATKIEGMEKYIQEMEQKFERACELITNQQGEIERVRERLYAENAEIEKLVERLQLAEDDNSRLTKLNEQLREALREVAAVAVIGRDFVPARTPERFQKIQDIARKALIEGEG